MPFFLCIRGSSPHPDSEFADTDEKPQRSGNSLLRDGRVRDEQEEPRLKRAAF